MSRYKILLLILLAGLSFSAEAQSQPPEWEWAKPGWGYYQAITKDVADNIYVTGYVNIDPKSPGGTYYFDGKEVPGAVHNSIFIAKYTRNGYLSWVKCFGDGKNNFTIDFMNTDKYGNLYINGIFKDSVMLGSHLLRTGNYEDEYIAKLDKAGNILWTTTSNVPSNGHRKSGLGVDSQGNVIICGNYYGTASFGNIALPERNSGSGYIVKYNTQGQAVWGRAIVSASLAGLQGISADAGGNVYITGFCYDSTAFDNVVISAVGGSVCFTAKYNKDGTLTWVKNSNVNNDLKSRHVTTDTEGSVYVSGQRRDSLRFGNVTVSDPGSQFLVKYDRDGNEQWAKSIPEPLNKPGDNNGLTTDNANNVYVCGNFALPGYLCKYTPDGNLLWKILEPYNPNSALREIRGVIVTNAGNAHIVAINHAAKMGSQTFTTDDGPMVFAKLGKFPTGINDIQTTNTSSLRLYPNPANTTLNISNTEAFEAVSIYDITGKIVFSKKTSKTKELTIDIEKLVPGLYTLQADKGTPMKFIKE